MHAPPLGGVEVPLHRVAEVGCDPLEVGLAGLIDRHAPAVVGHLEIGLSLGSPAGDPHVRRPGVDRVLSELADRLERMRLRVGDDRDRVPLVADPQRAGGRRGCLHTCATRAAGRRAPECTHASATDDSGVEMAATAAKNQRPAAEAATRSAGCRRRSSGTHKETPPRPAPSAWPAARTGPSGCSLAPPPWTPTSLRSGTWGRTPPGLLDVRPRPVIYRRDVSRTPRAATPTNWCRPVPRPSSLCQIADRGHAARRRSFGHQGRVFADFPAVGRTRRFVMPKTCLPCSGRYRFTEEWNVRSRCFDPDSIFHIRRLATPWRPIR